MPIYKNNMMIYRSGRYKFDNANLTLLLESVKTRFPRANLDPIRRAVPLEQLITRRSLQRELAKALTAQNLAPAPEDLQAILQSVR